jgi:hypothetical protein
MFVELEPFNSPTISLGPLFRVTNLPNLSPRAPISFPDGIDCGAGREVPAANTPPIMAVLGGADPTVDPDIGNKE